MSGGCGACRSAECRPWPGERTAVVCRDPGAGAWKGRTVAVIHGKATPAAWVPDAPAWCPEKKRESEDRKC